MFYFIGTDYLIAYVIAFVFMFIYSKQCSYTKELMNEKQIKNKTRLKGGNLPCAINIEYSDHPSKT